MVIKRNIWLGPAGEERTLHIWLPDKYDSRPEERYPVMYFFDGHNLFFDVDATYGKSWGLYDFLKGWEKPVIVVGMECSHHGTDRLTEYCPYHFTKGFLGEINGTGDTTVRFLLEKVKPLIDAEYRTIPFRECTAIGGSSMGGLMSLYAVIRYNRWFSKAACLSSSIMPCVPEFLEDITRCELNPDTRVYLSWGSEEAGEKKNAGPNGPISEAAACNSTLAGALLDRDCLVRLFRQEGGRHCEADWEKQVPLFMNYLWCDRWIDE